ncbi:Uncharacterised protein [Vibrio cholerae]|nr:Uncharacterised protein [Vibrio cholerae]
MSCPAHKAQASHRKGFSQLLRHEFALLLEKA